VMAWNPGVHIRPLDLLFSLLGSAKFHMKWYTINKSVSRHFYYLAGGEKAHGASAPAGHLPYKHMGSWEAAFPGHLRRGDRRLG
jgi:hypothetical protein